MTEYSVDHASFTIERRYDFPLNVVFRAFADPAAKRKWFIEGEGWTIDGYDADFRVGGFERSRFRFGDGPPMGNDTVYLDIVANRRIIIAYSMTMGDTPFSASLATIEFAPDGEGTRLTYTEQAAFLDGKDQVKDRETGCRSLFEALAAHLGARRG
jgi:uncharacterized protein YndB with AHSA1/START domain